MGEVPAQSPNTPFTRSDLSHHVLVVFSVSESQAQAFSFGPPKLGSVALTCVHQCDGWYMKWFHFRESWEGLWSSWGTGR